MTADQFGRDENPARGGHKAEGLTPKEEEARKRWMPGGLGWVSSR